VSEQQARRRKPVPGISEEFHAPPRLLPFVSGNNVVIPMRHLRAQKSILSLDKRPLIIYIRRVPGIKINIRIVTRKHTEIQVLTI